jgi:hypothetical protein
MVHTPLLENIRADGALVIFFQPSSFAPLASSDISEVLVKVFWHLLVQKPLVDLHRDVLHGTQPAGVDGGATAELIPEPSQRVEPPSQSIENLLVGR